MNIGDYINSVAPAPRRLVRRRVGRAYPKGTTLAGGLAYIFAGGPGSGCNGPNCGRPRTNWEDLTPQEKVTEIYKQTQKYKKGLALEDLKKQALKEIQKHSQPTTKTAKKWWKKELKRQAKLKAPILPGKPKFSKKQQKWLKKNAKLNLKQPTSIKPAPVWKGKVKTQYKTATGAQVSIIKPAGQYEKSGLTWLKKESPWKGQFQRDFELEAAKQFQENAKVAFFTARDPEAEKAQAVQVLRNFGEKKVSVTEMALEQYDAIARSRQVTFPNIGMAYGFLNKRYGITFKLK